KNTVALRCVALRCVAYQRYAFLLSFANFSLQIYIKFYFWLLFLTAQRKYKINDLTNIKY
ncbi:MAG: hypothetical protein K5685_07530, partial [Bacteroidales bacterium]|nr:hypothetical protein [Bacteroidales bacterium]